MTCADRMAEEITAPEEGANGEGASAEVNVALAWSRLWMLPLLLMQVICELFSQHLVRLKKMRRSRPLPRDWASFYPMLREAEWPIHVLLAEGARQLLSGQPLNLRAVPCDPDPPDTFQPPMPRSGLAMHQRIEATARFNADPEAHVRRHAARIRARAALRLEPRPGPRPEPRRLSQAVPVAIAVAVAVPVAIPVVVPVAGLCIRAPP